MIIKRHLEAFWSRIRAVGLILGCRQGLRPGEKRLRLDPVGMEFGWAEYGRHKCRRFNYCVGV